MKLKAFFKKLGQTFTADTSAAPVLPSAPAETSQPVTSPVTLVPSQKEKVIAPKMVAPPPRPAAAPSLKVVSPLSLKGGAKTQSDWLLLQIGKTGRAFISVADKNKLSANLPQATAEAFVRHDMTAALLGYRLVLTAYHVHQDVPSLEALRIVRTAMIGMLHRAVDITVEQTGKKEQRQQMLTAAEDQFRFAEAEVAAACALIKNKGQEPFAPFYSSLIPAFGAAASPAELHQRYGKILSEIFAKIESTMAARNHQITG